TIVSKYVFVSALKALSHNRFLGRDPHRAGVAVAYPHHYAARRDQRRSREAELVGAEQRADYDVAAGAHAAVDLHRDASAQPVGDQRLVGLGEADLPGRTGALDGGGGGRPGA